MNRFKTAFQIAAATVAFAVPAVALAQDGTASPGSAPEPMAVTALTKCVAGHINFKADTGVNYTTTSTTYVNVPNTNITFKIGGLNPACVAITFSSYNFASNPQQLLFVRAVIDGVPISPFDVQLAGDEDEDADGAWARARTATWVAPSIAAGTHTAQIQFLSAAGGLVAIHKPTTTVLSK